MSVVWSMTYAGLTQSLASWGIEKRSVQFVSLDADTFTFEMPVDQLTGNPPFPYGATLDLFRDSVRWFSGTVTKFVFGGNSKRNSITYTVSNAWWQLDNLIFQDNMLQPFDPVTPGSRLVEVFSSLTVLFQDVLGNPRKNGDQITLTLNYAIGKKVPLQIGTIDPNIFVPNEEANALACSAVLRRACRWQPDTVSSFDYTTNPPTVNFRRRGNLDAVTFDLNAANIVTSLGFTPRYDLSPAGVHISIKHTMQYSNGTAQAWYEDQFAGIKGDGVGCVVMTIPLSANGSSEEPVPINLATEFFDAVSTLHYEGDLNLKEQDCSGSVRPGKVLNCTNRITAWASMNALVQTVTEDLALGVTTAHVGPPVQLSPQDLLALAAISNGEPSTGLAAGRSSAGAGLPSLASSIMNEGTPVQVCDTDTGLPKTIYVRAGAGS